MHGPNHFTCGVKFPGAWVLGLFAAGCCPTTAAPTAPAASYSMTLAPGEVRFFDAETPDSTTQINLIFRIESLDALLRLRQIDPGCLPGPDDACRNFYDTTLTPRPSGVVQFGNTLQPYDLRTRLVLENPSPDRSIALAITIEPRRAGCT
jgi:hypothetical protein